MPEPLPTPPAAPLPLALVPRVDQARHYYAQAKAANTLRSYRAGWQHFVRWCAAHTRAPLPATPQTLVRSRTARAAQVTPGTLASRVAAIRFAHQQRGHASPTTHPLVRDVLSGIRRTRGTRPVQVHGQTRDLLSRVLEATGERLRDQRTRPCWPWPMLASAGARHWSPAPSRTWSARPTAAPRCASAAAQPIPRAPGQTVPSLPLLWWGVRATLPCKPKHSEKPRCETEKAARGRSRFTLDM